MKKHSLIAALLLGMITSNLAYSEVVIGREYKSPDKHYSVMVIETKNYDQLIIIKNKTNNTTEAKIDVETLVNELQWAPDSECIITERHIANGSFCQIIYLNKNTWEEKEYSPKYKGNSKKAIYEDSNVESIKIANNQALITYSSRDKTPNGSYYKDRKTVIKVNLKTRKSKVIADYWLSD